MFYALSDSFTGSDPKQTTSGFANTKVPIAFRTKAQRDGWLKSTKLLTAVALSRDEAVKMAEKSNGILAGEYGDRIVQVYGEQDGQLPVYHVIQKRKVK